MDIFVSLDVTELLKACISRPMNSNRLQSFSSKALCSGDVNCVESSSITAEDGLNDDVVAVSLSFSFAFREEDAVVDNLSSNTSDASCCSSFIAVYDSEDDGDRLQGRSKIQFEVCGRWKMI